VTLYPLIRDRVLRTKDYDCKFLPDKNPGFVIAMAFVGHHVPCVVIVVCYAVVFYEIRRIIKTRPQDHDFFHSSAFTCIALLQDSASRLRLRSFICIHLHSLASRLGLKITTSFIHLHSPAQPCLKTRPQDHDFFHSSAFTCIALPQDSASRSTCQPCAISIQSCRLNCERSDPRRNQRGRREGRR